MLKKTDQVRIFAQLTGIYLNRRDRFETCFYSQKWEMIVYIGFEYYIFHLYPISSAIQDVWLTMSYQTLNKLTLQSKKAPDEFKNFRISNLINPPYFVVFLLQNN